MVLRKTAALTAASTTHKDIHVEWLLRCLYVYTSEKGDLFVMPITIAQSRLILYWRTNLFYWYQISPLDLLQSGTSYLIIIGCCQ